MLFILTRTFLVLVTVGLGHVVYRKLYTLIGCQPAGKFENPWVKPNESTIILGDFNTGVGNDAGVWKGVVGQHTDADLNENGRL